MNLIASNILAIIVLTGLLIIDSAGSVNLSFDATPHFCAISEGATVLITTTSILSVLLIGVDQYLAVVDPLRYRTRIDKLRCALLILAVWLIAAVFGGLASINPQPRTLWWFCSPQLYDNNYVDDQAATELRFQASLIVNTNSTETANMEIEGEFNLQDPEGIYNATGTIIFRNSSDIEVDEDIYEGVSDMPVFGLAYALVFALFGYLVPFLAVCWIYVRIYAAARNNSERTRRNGSRPILSSGSFSEEGNGNGYGHRMDSSVEDFRRIPKISSLSSIDENSEATPSQVMAPSPHNEHAQFPDIEEEAAAVIFTVGSTKVDVSQRRDDVTVDIDADDDDNAKDSTKSKVPIAALKAHFLMSDNKGETVADAAAAAVDDRSASPDIVVVKSKFPDVPEQRRKSSHDLMYEEMMLACDKHPYEYEDELDQSSDEDDDDRDELHRHHDFEEALPLSTAEGFVAQPDNVDAENPHSSTRSISVNFDLADNEQPNAENSKMLSQSNQYQNHPVNNSPSHPPPIVTITPPGQRPMIPSIPSTLHRVPSVKSTNSYINNLKYRISNGSLFKYREETRAARISALVIVMGLICWTPYVYYMVTSNLPFFTDSEQLDLASVYSRPSLVRTPLAFLILGTIFSPLLFGYRSKRVKRELRKFFCFKRELSYKNNRSLMAKKVLRRRHSGATILGPFSSESGFDNTKYNIFNCVYGKNKWPKDKVQFVQVPDTALAVETCRSSFSSGASTQISSTSTDEC